MMGAAGSAAERGPEPTGGAEVLRSWLMCVVIASAILLVFFETLWINGLSVAALVLYLVSARRQFSAGTWVPVILSVGALILALANGVPGATMREAVERMLFLSALIAVLSTLRSAAFFAPEVRLAGAWLTGQPAPRRYLSLSLGGHLFGVLINFGGLALLLDIAKRSMDTETNKALPPDIRDVKLRRMTLATIRGFGLISLWSPLGFATNALLITLPGLSYLEFGPIGFVMSFVFIGIGWLFDRAEGRRLRGRKLPRSEPPCGGLRGAGALVGHVLIVGTSVFAVHGAFPLSFQEALLLVVPSYGILWSAASGLRSGIGAFGGVGEAGRDYGARLPWMGAEVGVFASAGFLPVILVWLVPVDGLQAYARALDLGPVQVALALTVSITIAALVGINPIVSTSVLGTVALQLDLPGLTPQVIALAAIGGWTTVIGLSPFITTIILSSAIVNRSVWTIGPRWNGTYCLTILCIWMGFMVALMKAGLI